MGVSWSQSCLGDVCSEITDGAHQSPKSVQSGMPMASVKDLNFWGLDLDSARHISEKDYETLVRQGCKPWVGDVLIAKDGNSALDTVCVVKEPQDVVLLSSVAILRPDPNQIDSMFLKYYFMSPNIIDYLKSNFISGAAIPRVILRDFKQAEILLPELDEQKAIAHILGTLDDKIELNRQMNATLEAMAQALFKSWFVDFDPVIDNALAAGNPIPEPLRARADARKALGDQRKPLPETIQKQFPNRFVFNDDMGWVPEGWEVGVFGNIALHVKDNVKADSVGDHDFYVGLEHIGRKTLFLCDNATGESIESNKSRFTESDLLFGKLRPYFHKVCIAPQDGICSTDILVFRAKSSSWHSYMLLTAYRDEFVEYANIRSTGTRMPRASAKDMLGYQISTPPDELAEMFESEVSVLWERGKQNVVQSRELAKLRDTLLPKLLSGQLRLPEAEQTLAQVM